VFDVAASPALKQSINHMRFWFHVIVSTDQARANPEDRTNEQAPPRQRPAPGPGSSPTHHDTRRTRVGQGLSSGRHDACQGHVAVGLEPGHGGAVAKLADADVKGLALEVTAEVPCDGINGFDSPDLRAATKSRSERASSTARPTGRPGRRVTATADPFLPGRVVTLVGGSTISLAISAASRDRKRRMVTSSSGSTNARNPPATAL
jgi:hypothetical protein